MSRCTRPRCTRTASTSTPKRIPLSEFLTRSSVEVLNVAARVVKYAGGAGYPPGVTLQLQHVLMLNEEVPDYGLAIAPSPVPEVVPKSKPKSKKSMRVIDSDSEGETAAPERRKAKPMASSKRKAKPVASHKCVKCVGVVL